MRALTFRSSLCAGRTAVGAMCFGRLWASSTSATEGSEKQNVTEDSETVSVAPVSPEAYAKLEKELSDAKERIAELKKEVLYRAADAENARRIGSEDVTKAKAYGITSFGKDMLDVVDTLERGLEAITKLPQAEVEGHKTLSSIHTGIKLSLKLLLNNLAKHGIEKLDVAVGAKFDPNFHDALLKVPPTAEAPPGHISTVLKTGYKIQDRVLRASQVGVASDD
ncbi:co-chaperone GrpE, putative [Trypanosoma brucei brucei TREU927]|uniref:GrpE protein homolog n=1 Tax=Trypanosoma brucei brucei (strain 927/4 GUTat10.1) TaxID=185431 RepID=Q584T9_TRYB2|nr:co-chaperone GrpE, putative [Trypanosoma brucei brucei TREU927]AAX80850.1 co-chaperone GrpE, putative [Trypanosoma brucei]AAZ11779.1 co-chaperone GrpE, putative [Trypanosoma brucei brucei TREU927]